MTRTPADDSAYWALQHERLDPGVTQAPDRPHYRIATMVPLPAGRSVRAYTNPVVSIRELGDTVLEMRACAPTHNNAPWWPTVQRRANIHAEWVTLTDTEWRRVHRAAQ